MEPRKVEFALAQESLAGHLYVPETTPAPGVVIIGPLTSVKEQVATSYARELVGHGFVALAFDHRHFGESSGAPRQYEHPGKKIEDVQAAVGYLQSLPEVRGDAIFALGVCAGGGYMARAVSLEPRFRGFGAVAGFFHDVEMTQSWMGDGYQAGIDRAIAAREAFEKGEEAAYIPAVGLDDPDVAMPLKEAYEYYGTPRGAVANYTNRFAVQSREFTLPFDCQASAGEIAAPTLMVHSEKAMSPTLARKFFAALGCEKRQLWVESKGQIDFYDDAEKIAPVAQELASFYKSLL